MLLDSQEKKLQNFVTPKKESAVAFGALNPSQVRAGIKEVMSYQERLAWLRSSEIGKLFGFKQQT